ncbi:MAG: trypsin-like peptidase domain-containing protein [Cyanobacteria bacterium J06573_2]
MTTTFTNISTELTDIAQKIRNSSVKIRSGNTGFGSGVIWESDGLIITNAHVATSKKLTVELSDGRKFTAIRTKIDPTRDLAALKVNTINLNLNSAIIGDSDKLRVGEIALAIGNPLGDSNAVTTGIISQIQRNSIISDIQLFPGNSGGAMTDASGKLIGINTMIAYGLSVAISSNTVKRFLESVHENRSRKLGVILKPLTIEIDRQPSVGLLVLSVNHQSDAEAMGIQIGDIIYGCSGRLFQQPDDLTNYLQLVDDKEVSQLQILRGGKQIVLNIAFSSGKATSNQREQREKVRYTHLGEQGEQGEQG